MMSDPPVTARDANGHLGPAEAPVPPAPRWGLGSIDVPDVDRLPPLPRLPRWRLGDDAFRFILVAAQAATIILTWPLWQARRAPAALPLFPLPEVDCGPLMLASLAVAVARPRVGVALHAAVFAWAAVADQTRLQPEVVSILLLLAATLGIPAMRDLARAHLIALWLYAGLSKLAGP